MFLEYSEIMFVHVKIVFLHFFISFLYFFISLFSLFLGPQPYCGFTCTNVVPQCNIFFFIFFNIFCLHLHLNILFLGTTFLGSLRNGGTCNPSFCNNRGTCELVLNNKHNGTATTNNFACHCSTGWAGNKCEFSKKVFLFPSHVIYNKNILLSLKKIPTQMPSH